MAPPIFQLLLTDSDSAGCNYAAETSLLVWMLQQGEAADCSKAWSFAAFLRVLLQTVMLVTATTVVDDVDDSRTFWMWLRAWMAQKSSMKRWSNLQSPLWGDTQPIFALREAFAGRSWCEHLCWRCGAWGRRLRCDGWWLGTIQSHCGLLFRKLWGKFLTWLALTSFLVWFLWVYDTVYGSNYGASSKKGREERWDHMESLKTPKTGCFEEQVFLL